MSKLKVGDKLVALESVKSVGLFIPKQQLDILPGVIATVIGLKESGSFKITFDGCDSHSGGWSFTSACSKHFVKIPSVGDVVTELVIPEGKSLSSININPMTTGENPVGGSVLSSNRRNKNPWLPQDASLSTGYFWPVSWLRFKYQDEQVAQVEPAPYKFKVGDKFRFKSRKSAELKGKWTPQDFWCIDGKYRLDNWIALPDDHTFTVDTAPYQPGDGNPDVVFSSPEVGGGWYALACDLVLVGQPEDTATPALPTKVKLTKKQKSAKRLSKYIHKAQIESRVLRDLLAGQNLDGISLADFAISLHEPKREARAIAKSLCVELEEWELAA